jgi:hypothetical protein
MRHAWIRLAACIVPARRRVAWRAQWTRRVDDWRLLADRGEPVGPAAPLLRRAFLDAVAERCGPIQLKPFLRSAVFVPIALAAAFLLLTAASRGFAVTRHVLDLAHDIRLHPTVSGYDVRGDRIAVYLAPTVMAVAIALGLLAAGCRRLRERGWRYWSFLACKALSSLILIALIWVELGTLLRAPIHREGWRLLFGLFSVATMIVGMARAILWTIADQRRRCPVCLRFLVAPVSVGSWASSFEPPATELLCERGHGAFAVADTETNGQDRWTRLDESWKALFG